MLQDKLSPFFNPMHFAQAVVLGGETVRGIFDDAYAVGQAGPLGMATSMPTLLLPAAAVPVDPVGLSVEVGGQRFVVADPQPDGTGCVLLILEISE